MAHKDETCMAKARTSADEMACKSSTFTCLAVSSDGGVTFAKPKLGIVSIGQSGTANNCVWPPVSGQPHETGNVFIDTKPGVSPVERYKMVCRWTPPGGQPGTYTFASPDGQHFQPLGNKPAYLNSDTGNVAMWDSQLGKYVAKRIRCSIHRMDNVRYVR